MKHKHILACLLALLLLLCSGCGRFILHYGSDDADNSSLLEQVFSPSNQDTQNLTAPLTGLPQTEDTSARRPYAVMVNNIIYAQPQVGISQADWIYEIPAEGGITRMMAIFSHISDVPSVGSIRSLRPYYLSIALSYDAIVIHGGGSDDAYRDLETLNAEHLDGVRDDHALAAMFYRDMTRAAHGTEHTLFFSGEKVPALVEEYGFRTTHNADYQTGLHFSDQAAEQGNSSANQICVTFNNSKTTNFTFNFDYSGAGGFYTAEQYGSEYADGASGEVVSFANVLVLQTDMRAYDDYGRLEADVIGSGDGWLFIGGRCAAIHWSRASLYEPFQYTLADGTPAQLAPGRTFAAVIPTDTGEVSFS